MSLRHRSKGVWQIFMQHGMILNRLLDPLRFNTNVPLCGGGTAVLQEPLHKGNVIATVLVDLCGIPFAEAVSADSIETQIVTDNVQLLLYCPFCHWKNDICALDPLTQAVVLNVLLNDKRDSKSPALAGLLLYNIQPESVTISYNVA